MPDGYRRSRFGSFLHFLVFPLLALFCKKQFSSPSPDLRLGSGRHSSGVPVDNEADTDGRSRSR